MSDAKQEKLAHIWAREANEWYSEPDWIWHRFFEEEMFFGPIFDPSCGRGNVVEAAIAAGHVATGSDIVPAEMRGNFQGYEPKDFMGTSYRIPNLCSNPPFNLCDPKDKDRCYVRKALRETHGAVALLLPTVWINARSWLRATPLATVYFLTPRPSMPPGHVIAAGEKPGSGTKDFAVYVWRRGHLVDPSVRWLHRDEGSKSWR